MRSDQEQLVRYNGKYWSWWGMKDRRGDLCLYELMNTSFGTQAPERLCRIVEGEEYERQMDAIHWLRSRVS